MENPRTEENKKNKVVTPDVQKIMEEIRARVKRVADEMRDEPAERKLYDANLNNQHATRKHGELLHSEDLRYLNQNYAFGSRIDTTIFTSHRPGIFGKAIVGVKKLGARIIEVFLRGYLTKEREYQSHVVRFLNDVGKYVDARDSANFWELIRKIDYDVTKTVEHIEKIRDDMEAELSRSIARAADVGGLKSNAAELSDRIKTMDSVVRGLETIVAKIGKVPTTSASSSLAISEKIDYSYLLLENRFRGSEEEISKRLEPYVELFRSAKKPILEIGSGRGELQMLLKKAGVNSSGIDLDKAMVERCKEQGLNVQFGNGLEYLDKVADGSLGGVIAIQVVEHLTRAQLERLFTLCSQKVAKGGKIVFETINPRSVLALSSNYFRDPTHIWPLHPDTLSYQMQLCGLKINDVKFLSPVPREAQLRELGASASPEFSGLLSDLNGNIRQLNELLYGFQDYCVIAEA